tara:strand:- start:25 stop:852 length:828 start_codon:yes stop_codon:yes gene_type:complete
MMRLLHIEYLKWSKNSTTYVYLGLYIGLFLCVLLGSNSLTNSFSALINQFNPEQQGDYHVFSFPYVWHGTAFIGKFFKFLLACLAIYIFGEEYKSGNLKQSIVHGQTRKEIFISQLLIVSFLSLFSTLVISISALSLGFKNTENISWEAGTKLYYLGLSFINTFTYLSIATLLAHWTKNIASAIILLLVFWLLGDWFISLFIPESISILKNFTPFDVIDELIPLKEFVGKGSLLEKGMDTYYETRPVPLYQLIISCIAYCLIYWTLTYRILKKDL